MTNLFKGFAAYALYGQESIYGTAVAATKSVGKLQSFTPNNNNNLIGVRGIGEGRNVVQSVYGKYDCSGSLSFFLQDGAIFKGVIGTNVTTGVGPYTHTMTEADTLPSYTIEVGYVGTASLVDTYSGVKFNTMKMNLSQGNIVTIDADWIAQKPVTSSTAQTPVFSSVCAYTFYQGAISLAASPLALIDSGDITFDQGLLNYVSIGSRFINEPIEGARNYPFNLTLKLRNDTDIIQRFYGAVAATTPKDGSTGSCPDSFAMAITLTGGTGRSFVVNLTNCVINTVGKPIASPDEQVIVLTASGWAQSAGIVYIDAVASP